MCFVKKKVGGINNKPISSAIELNDNNIVKGPVNKVCNSTLLCLREATVVNIIPQLRITYK
tara:strand:- start:1499 stop:1681 length:183 start_codon:yes stop_codon:yes gene_type:complete